jgi:hypothetical protein
MAGVPTGPAALAATASDHAGTIPLIVAGVALLLVAGVVRRLIKLALVVAVVGIVALIVAAWRAGVFG